MAGPIYPEYLEKEVYAGKARASDLLPRQIMAINLREMFSASKENILAHETAYKKRRHDL